MDIIKTPQTDINAFLTDEINIDIYENLCGMGMSMKRDFEGEVNLLDFFNILFADFEFFNNNLNNYLKLKEYFIDYSPDFYKEDFKDDTQFYVIRYVVYGMLNILIKKHYPKKNRKGLVISSCLLIKKLEQKLHEAVNKDNDWKPNLDISDIKPQSKSLLFNSKPLNIQERYNIAVKVADLENKINHLSETSKEQKNQLLAYILGCNIDTAKKLLNGSYDSKPRNLTTYFTDLGLNK